MHRRTCFSVEVTACVNIVPNAHMPTPRQNPEQVSEQSSQQISEQSPKRQERLTSSGTNGSKSPVSQEPHMAVFSTGLQGEFRACNAAFTRLIGYSAQELLGRDFSTLFAVTEKINGGDPSLLRKAILAVASTQGDYEHHLFAQPKSGASFAVQFSATLLRDSASTPMAVIAV